MIGNDGGGDKEMVRSSGGRSFQRRGAVMDMAESAEGGCILSFSRLHV